MADTQAFIDSIKDGAIQAQQEHGILASLTIAQAILESGWGTTQLATEAHNLFGIKGVGPAGSVDYPTTEFEHGIEINVTASFRKYDNPGQSLLDHTQFLIENERYANLKGVTDYGEACHLISQDNYASDPDYPAKLIEIIQENNLTQYDQAPTAEPVAQPEPAPAKAFDPTPVGGQIYYVQPGDTLSRISLETQIPVDVLARVNGLDDPNWINAGEPLKIPAIYRVKAGDTLSEITPNWESVAKWNQINPDVIYVGQVLYI